MFTQQKVMCRVSLNPSMRTWAECCFCLRGVSLKHVFGVLLTSRSRHQFLRPEALHGNVLGFSTNNWKSLRKPPRSPGTRSTTPETSAEDDWALVSVTANTVQPPNVQPRNISPKVPSDDRDDGQPWVSCALGSINCSHWSQCPRKLGTITARLSPEKAREALQWEVYSPCAPCF